MNIMVFDVPAEYGGALSILNEFYNEVINHQDDSINWTFVLSKPKLGKTKNIKVLNYPWVKKSWLHRLYFDYVIAPKLIRAHKIDRVFSFQNVVIPRVKVPQVLYIHQPLPFIEHRFSFKENKIFWIYQNIISKKIYKSIRIANKVIVQTEWLKNESAKRSHVLQEKISVLPPRINLHIENYFSDSKVNRSTFFYPSSSYIYKNHKIIIEACKLLKNQGIIEYNVVFTLRGNEEKHIDKLKKEVKKNNLPVHFIGSVERDRVFKYYTESVLLFPSYIETYGLPMLEAMLHGSPIIASDALFSREILDKYPNAYFFNSFKAQELAEIMKKMIMDGIKYKIESDTKSVSQDDIGSLLQQILGALKSS